MKETKLLLVKNSKEVGAIAIDTSLFSNPSDLYSYISLESVGSFIQVVFVEGIDAYKEYYPIKYFEEPSEFLCEALSKIN